MLYLCPLQINYYYNKNKNDNKSKQRTEQIKQKMKFGIFVQRGWKGGEKRWKKKVRNRKQVSSFYLLLSLEKFSSFLRQNLLHNTK